MLKSKIYKLLSGFLKKTILRFLETPLKNARFQSFPNALSGKLLKKMTFFFIFLSVLTCKSNLAKLTEIEENYDKYQDQFNNFEYFNKKLHIKILFDRDWIIKTQFKDFSDNEKKFAKYFSSLESEVLFIGYNDSKKIGVKLVKENLGIKNSEYLDKIKSVNSQDTRDYKISFVSEKNINLRNLQTTNVVLEASLNSANNFTFDVFLFKNEKDNFRLDFWIKSSNYDSVKEYVKTICQTIDFPEGDKYVESESSDETSDLTTGLDLTSDVE